jgi:hypothetical protein
MDRVQSGMTVPPPSPNQHMKEQGDWHIPMLYPVSKFPHAQRLRLQALRRGFEMDALCMFRTAD